MLNRVGYKIFLVLFVLYAISILIYELFVINVLGRDFGIYVLGFTVINLLINAITLQMCPRLCKRNSKKASSLSFFALLLTLMTFVTVVCAKNFLEPFYFLIALISVFLIYLLFSIPIWIYCFKGS